MGFVSDIIGGGAQSVGKDLTYQNQYQAGPDPELLTRQKSLERYLTDVLYGNAQLPDPAQVQLQQNLDAISAQQAGAIGSQKGISPGLAARLISQQGGQSKMQGAQTAALQQAQQRANALGALQQQQSMISGQGLGYSQLNANTAQQNANAVNQATMGVLQGATKIGTMAATGGKTPAWEGGVMKHGGEVPGEAEVPGDSPKNDKVHAILSPGEIVVPRSLVEDPERAKKFIELIKKDVEPGYAKVLSARKKKNGKKE